MNTSRSFNFAAANSMGMNLSLPVSRRDALRIGLFSTAGLLLADGRVLGAADAPPTVRALPVSPIKTKAKSVIQIFLWGGMSHNDTWDPKPDSGYDYMGEFRTAIPTNVDGIQLGELFVDGDLHRVSRVLEDHWPVLAASRQVRHQTLHILDCERQKHELALAEEHFRQVAKVIDGDLLGHGAFQDLKSHHFTGAFLPMPLRPIRTCRAS